MDATRRPAGTPAALLHGLPGHPLHPPLTDATIGMFVLAAALAVVGAAGAIEDAAGEACWLALIGGGVGSPPPPPARVAGWGVPRGGRPRGGGGGGAPDGGG